MFDKEKVNEAIKNIDMVLGLSKIIDPVLTRQEHFTLLNNTQLVQDVCMAYFEEREEVTEGKKDVSATKTKVS